MKYPTAILSSSITTIVSLSLLITSLISQDGLDNLIAIFAFVVLVSSLWLLSKYIKKGKGNFDSISIWLIVAPCLFLIFTVICFYYTSLYNQDLGIHSKRSLLHEVDSEYELASDERGVALFAFAGMILSSFIGLMTLTSFVIFKIMLINKFKSIPQTYSTEK